MRGVQREALVCQALVHQNAAQLPHDPAEAVVPWFRTHVLLTPRRFDFDWEQDIPVKLNNFFEFPRELDMVRARGWCCCRPSHCVQGPYTKDGLAYREQHGQAMPKQPENTYVLSGIVVHSGQANGGHYYSFIRRPSADGTKHQWLRFDDTDVCMCIALRPEPH